ncbi:MAG: hypothetical protein OEV35_03090 [Gallionellaceae bacterium]|nr:hypothetical protein [Gallionellaceae bacterium]
MADFIHMTWGRKVLPCAPMELRFPEIPAMPEIVAAENLLLG